MRRPHVMGVELSPVINILVHLLGLGRILLFFFVLLLVIIQRITYMDMCSACIANIVARSLCLRRMLSA